MMLGYGLKGETKTMLDVHHDFRASFTEPNIEIYNALLAGFLRRDHVALCQVIIEEIEKLQITPTLYTYNLCLLVSAQSRQPETIRSVKNSTKQFFFFFFFFFFF